MKKIRGFEPTFEMVIQDVHVASALLKLYVQQLDMKHGSLFCGVFVFFSLALE
ncbi:hypothetical protein Hanom_Chr01g00043441 [Helianthus anomalus]